MEDEAQNGRIAVRSTSNPSGSTTFAIETRRRRVRVATGITRYSIRPGWVVTFTDSLGIRLFRIQPRLEGIHGWFERSTYSERNSSDQVAPDGALVRIESERRRSVIATDTVTTCPGRLSQFYPKDSGDISLSSSESRTRRPPNSRRWPVVASERAGSALFWGQRETNGN